MKTPLLLIAVLLLWAPAYAENAPQITGAFGVEFGDVFHPTEQTETADLTDGTTGYKFTPKKGFREFSDFYVLITPKTHKVYSIWAVAKLRGIEQARHEREVVFKILNEKYGPDDLGVEVEELAPMAAFSKADSLVFANIEGDASSGRLQLSYSNGTLRKTAAAERLELDVADAKDAPF